MHGPITYNKLGAPIDHVLETMGEFARRSLAGRSSEI